MGSFATVCLWKSEANLRELVFFLLRVAWGLNSKVKCLYLMSILSVTNFLKFLFYVYGILPAYCIQGLPEEARRECRNQAVVVHTF